MLSISYNDMQFTVESRDGKWDISYATPKGPVYAGAGLFAGLAEAEARTRALTLIKTVFPVGVKVVGPDVTHPNMIGDLKIVGPDVTHPNFIYWNKDTASCPK